MIIMKEEVRKYIEEHDNVVSNEEVTNYILEVKKIPVKKDSIRVTVYQILNETGGMLKFTGVTQAIRDYLKKNDGRKITLDEVVYYVIKIRKINSTRNGVKSALCRVRKELRKQKK